MANKTETTAFKAPAIDKLPRGEANIGKAIASIKVRGAKLQNDVHIAACAVLQHLIEHKDIRIVGKLMDALPASYRTNAVRDWFTAFGPVAWEKNKPVFNKQFNMAEADQSFRQAVLDPFWLFSPEAVYQPINLNVKLEQLIKALVKDQDKTGAKHGHAIAVLEGLKSAPPAAPAPAPADADPLAA